MAKTSTQTPADQTDDAQKSAVTENPKTTADTARAGTAPAQIAPTTDTTAPLDPWHTKPGEVVVPVSTDQTEEVANANTATPSMPVVGTLHRPMSVKELRDELMSKGNIAWDEVDKWIVGHFKAHTGTIDGLAQAANMTKTEVVKVLKEVGGFKFSQGM